MAFRRRRSKGTWLPRLGHRPETDPDTMASLTDAIAVDVPADGSPIFGIIPITYDSPPEGGVTTGDRYDLAAIVGSEYICKRILGQIFVSRGSLPLADRGTTTAAVHVTAGIFVARRDDDIEHNTPIGYFDSSLQENLQNYSPDRQETAMMPWMWKRDWMLGDPQATAFANFNNPNLYGASFFPPTNVGLSLKEGTHIDVKTRRRVAKDHRLFLVVQARGWPYSPTSSFLTVPTNDAPLYVGFTCRLFGTIVKPRNRSSF